MDAAPRTPRKGRPHGGPSAGKSHGARAHARVRVRGGHTQATFERRATGTAGGGWVLALPLYLRGDAV